MDARDPRGTGRFFLSFASRELDVTREPENPINPIPGQSLLVWLTPILERAGYRVDAPATEDWGWYVTVLDAAGDRFVVGASAVPCGEDPVDWTLCVWRERTLLQWLRGAPVLRRDAPLLRSIEQALSGPEFTDLELTELTHTGPRWSFFSGLVHRTR